MNKILGVSSAHDSSICLLEDGKIKYFTKEERITGKKRDKFPVKSLSSINTNNEEVYFAHSAPFIESDYAEYILEIGKKFHNITQAVDYSGLHHLVHANLAFYNSGFKEALVLVIDRNGTEYNNSCREAETVFVASYPNNFKEIYKNFWMLNSTAHFMIDEFKNNNPECEVDIKSMYGIVKVYETATTLIKQDALENGKVMGLSAYGNKNLKQQQLFIKDNIANDHLFAHENGYNQQAINTELQHFSTNTITKDNYQLYADYAWSVQKQTQEAVANLINKYVEKTGIKNVCITGGYGLNVVANYYYITQFPDINFFFEPMADDSGNSIGAAMKMYRDETLDTKINKLEHTFFNGKNYNLSSIRGKQINIEEIAKILSDGKSIAVYNGLAEAGPRSLGNRSILFDPRDKDAKDKVNMIKRREWYRPFAGMVLENDANKYFNMFNIKKSDFMTVSFPVTDYAKENIPGVIHVDDTCRIQTVDESNIVMFNLLNEFKKITGIGVLLNTSFNLAGKPLVETPNDAIDTLKNSVLDYVWFPEISVIISKEDLQK